MLALVLFVFVQGVTSRPGEPNPSVFCSGSIGEPCIDRLRCCFGECIDGFCNIANNTLRSRCGDNYCLPGEQCYIPTIQCISGGGCEAKPECRVSQVQVEVDPCNYVKCDEGYKCSKDYCFLPPCPAKCVPKDNPCNPSPCGWTEQCYVNDHVNPYCVPADPCVTSPCPVGYDCVISTPFPGRECVVSNPCSNAVCLDGYDCFPRYQYSPPRADCVPRDVCKGVNCWQGFKCQMAVMHDHCVGAPCSPIIYPECVPEWM